jgi:hypothetical protein
VVVKFAHSHSGSQFPAAPAIALKLHHASAALWANQVDDGRNNARAAFARKCFEMLHIFAPSISWNSAVICIRAAFFLNMTAIELR